MWPIAPLEAHCERRVTGTGSVVWGVGEAKVVVAKVVRSRVESLLADGYMVLGCKRGRFV